MKKTLSVLLAIALCFTMFATFVGAEDAANPLAAFSDAPAADSWKHAGLVSAVENNIMKGDNGEIRPDDNLTRAELTAMMVRVLGAQNDKGDIAHLVDVAIDAWYTDYIKSGVAAKIITGAGNKMMPNDPVTREQAFAILARTFVLVADSHDAVESFGDAHHVSDWAKDAAAALIEKNVVQGGSSNDLRPKDNVTRAEYAAMLDRIVGEYAKPGKSYAGETIKGTIVITDPSVDLTGAIIEGDVIIADALGGKEIAIKDATVGGDLVVRAGSVTVSGETSVSNVVYGNPVHTASVKAEDGVKAEKVVVTENATEVKNEISAEKVEVSSNDANVTLGGDTEYKDVAIEGNNTEVKVDEGAKVENVVANGSSNTVSGSGSVDNAVVNGEGTKVETPNTNVTDNTPVTPSTPSTPDTPATPDTPSTPSTPDTPSTGGNSSSSGNTQSGAGDSPNQGSVPSSKDLKVSGGYIKYGNEKVPASVSTDKKTVTFDLTGIEDKETILDAICIEANVAKTLESPLAKFTTKNEVKVASLVAQVIENTNDQLLLIDDSEVFSIDVLENLVYDASYLYNLQSDIDSSYLFRDLFVAKGITVTENNDETYTSTFEAKYGKETYTLVIITKAPIFE